MLFELSCEEVGEIWVSQDLGDADYDKLMDFLADQDVACVGWF